MNGLDMSNFVKGTVIADVPEIGKEYDNFDDGKIKRSRLSKVKVVAVYDFEKAPMALKEEWAKEVKSTYWLYSPQTDCIVEAAWVGADEDEKNIFFIRSKDGGWFSMGFWAGRLDIDGSLLQGLVDFETEFDAQLAKEKEEKV